MPYQALYRSWRPQTFSDLVGQPHVKQTLTNAVLAGQVAHAYLFCGPRGTGKTSAAKVLAKAVNCADRNGADPCNECAACRSINAGSNVDVEEIDAASNRGVDEIRQLRDKVQYAPTTLTSKVYIIDEVHMLTTEAFNALLKTLEEPPGHTLFVLATTEPHKIPATIVSRCQRFDFRRIDPQVIVERLARVCAAQQWPAEEEALWKIAGAADGGLRDALGLLEQTAAYGEGSVTPEFAAHVVGGVETAALLEFVQALGRGDPLTAVELLLTWYASGKDAARIVQDLLQVLRDLFIVKLSATSPARALPGLPRERLSGAAQALGATWLLDAIKKLGETYTNLRYVDQPRLALEAAVLSLTPALDAPAQAPGRPPTGAVGAELAPARVRPQAGTVATAPDVNRTSGRAAERAEARRAGGQARKWEVLQQLWQRADAEVLQAVQSAWGAVLEAVHKDRIQTHAWLSGGRAVLCTAQEAVVAFSSRIHRDSVMKSTERALIEAALSSAVGRPMRMLALTREDWETFVNRQADASAGSTAEETSAAVETSNAEATSAAVETDLIDRAIAVFGKEHVEIRDGE